jgi:hypothetical protein
MRTHLAVMYGGVGGLLIIGACGGSKAVTAPVDDRSDLPAQYQKFGANVELYRDGDVVVIRTTGVPDHKSPYFGTGDSRYEAYNGTNPNFVLNPNRIAAGTVVYRIPLSPAEAASKAATPLGPIGVAVNGVPIYNQYAGPGRPLGMEIDSFDQYNGHPQQFGQYHYHVEPLYITAAKGKEALLGFLLDGFPVYGPRENGAAVAESALDAYHGHVSATADYPQGIYHYHVTAQDPYINGSGFFGTPGSVSR